jgi:RNA polymerase sigma-70 factor, ECF subfamily
LLTQTESESGDDARLLTDARENPARFAPIYERYAGRIYAYCLRRTATSQEAEDLTSAVFVRALTALPSYRGGSVAAWLFQIAHNQVANHLRSRERKPFYALDNVPEPSEDDTLLDRLVAEEEQTEVAQLVAKLPDASRELLALSIAGELTAREIGQVLGKSEGAVRMALHRLIGQLRAELYSDKQEVQP